MHVCVLVRDMKSEKEQAEKTWRKKNRIEGNRTNIHTMWVFTYAHVVLAKTQSDTHTHRNTCISIIMHTTRKNTNTPNKSCMNK